MHSMNFQKNSDYKANTRRTKNMLNNPIDFKTLKTIVRNVLILNTKTRSDDFILIGEVIKNLGINDKLPLNHLIEHHNELEIPSFESITRARRALQEKEPWLQAPVEVQQERALEEEQAREMFRNDKKSV